MRLFILTLALAGLAREAQAGPKRVLGKTLDFLDKHHIEFDMAIGGSSGAASAAVYDCHNDNAPNHEVCIAGYGSKRGTEIARAGFTAGMIFLSEYGRKHQIKEWPLPALGAGIFNTFEAAQQWHVHAKPEIGQWKIRSKKGDK